jgi:DNA-binding transcriptional LysR family regulator
MESIGSLNVFVRVAELHSFTAAATVLGVSSSAVGKAIVRLEERLGVRLFHRSTRSITLTAEGTLFLDRCRKILCELEAAEMEISQGQMAPRGRLRVSLPMAMPLMVPAILAFMQAYPDIELELDFNDRLVDVIAEGFDVVIRGGNAVDSRLRMREIGNYKHCIVASPSYLSSKGTPAVPEDLLKHACIRYRYPSTGKLQQWPLGADETFDDMVLPSVATVTTLEAQICIAENGFGLACVPAFSVEQKIKQGTLVAVLQPYMQRDGTFRLLWPASRHPSPKVAAFVHFMADNLFKKLMQLPH